MRVNPGIRAQAGAAVSVRLSHDSAQAHFDLALVFMRSTTVFPLQSLLIAILSVVLGGHYSGIWSLPKHEKTQLDEVDVDRWGCHPFLPTLFAETPPEVQNPLIREASRKLDKFLSERFSRGDIDSLSVAVVTSGGPVFERNYGVMRGNETGSAKTTSNSMYRIASVSKLFTALEGFILEQKGLLSWRVLQNSNVRKVE